MAQYVGPPKQCSGDSSGQKGQQGQGYYPPQQGLGGPRPQDFYPSMVSAMIIVLLIYTSLNPNSLYKMVTVESCSGLVIYSLPPSIASRAILLYTGSNKIHKASSLVAPTTVHLNMTVVTRPIPRNSSTCR